MTTTYTARVTHHSISRAPVHALRATTEVGAKREARRLLGDGFRGHTICLEKQVEKGLPLPVAYATIGQPGWETA